MYDLKVTKYEEKINCLMIHYKLIKMLYQGVIFLSVLDISLHFGLSSSDLFCPIKCKCEITTIDCSNIFLTSIPTGLSNLTTHLYLDGNFIARIAASDFENLPNLKVLGLSSNLITAINDFAFAKLSNLTRLILSDNRIAHLSSNGFAGLHQLTYLALSRIIPDSQSLCVADNAFSDLENLNTLKLDRNGLNYILEKTLTGLKNLKFLDLSHNKLILISEKAFNDLPAIQIDIDGDIACCCETILAFKSSKITGVRCIHQLTDESVSITGQECTNDILSECKANVTSTCKSDGELNFETSIAWETYSTSSQVMPTRTKRIHVPSSITGVWDSPTKSLDNNYIYSTRHGKVISVVESTRSITTLHQTNFDMASVKSVVNTAASLSSEPIQLTHVNQTDAVKTSSFGIVEQWSNKPIVSTKFMTDLKTSATQVSISHPPIQSFLIDMRTTRAPTKAPISESTGGIKAWAIAVIIVGCFLALVLAVFIYTRVMSIARGGSFWPWKKSTRTSDVELTQNADSNGYTNKGFDKQ